MIKIKTSFCFLSLACLYRNIICDKVFKNGPSKVCGRQPLKTFTRTILEYFARYNPNLVQSCVQEICDFDPQFWKWDKNVSLPQIRFFYFFPQDESCVLLIITIFDF